MDTFTFADPAWLWLLLLLPLAGWLKGATGTPPAVVYSSLSLVRQLQKIAPQKAGRLLWLLRWLALIVFILALARPQWGEGKQRIRASGIDIVVSMDLSDSMLAEDFQRFGRDANRLDVSKDVLEEFIKGRPSDRIGLIAFSGKAYIASPPTLNHAFLLENLDRFTTDTVPEEGTAIGSGISAAINRLREIKDSKSRIVILMTDGEENTGKIKGHEAATAGSAARGPAAQRASRRRGGRGKLATRLQADHQAAAGLRRTAAAGGRFAQGQAARESLHLRSGGHLPHGQRRCAVLPARRSCAPRTVQMSPSSSQLTFGCPQPC